MSPAAQELAPPPPVPRIARAVEGLAWLGTFLLLGAFAAVSNEWIERESFLYVSANVLGAGLVGVVCAWKRAWPALALEVAWIAITLSSDWSVA